MKARIKSNGKIVEVISRFMPRKRNAASRDWVCNLSDGTCINENQLEYIEESIDGLDEAAKEYEKRVIEETKCHHNALTYAEGYEDALLLIPDAFIAGAKWQEKKNQETIKLAEDHAFLAGADWQKEHTPLPEDTVLFNKGVAEGKRLMMEEAVEGEFLYTPYPTIALDDCKDYNFKDNQKVRIIIVKEDEK